MIATNKINPVRWSHDWYELTSTEELLVLLKQSKEVIHSGRKKNLSLWRKRIERLEDELQRRREALEDPLEMES